MKKKRKRITATFLALIMASLLVLPVFAEEEPQNLETEDFGLNEDNNNEEGIAEFTDEKNADGQDNGIAVVNDDGAAAYSIKIDKDKVSFGTNTIGTSVTDQKVTITNNGNKDVKLIWKETDPNQAFSVSAPASESIPVGGSADFYVGINDNLGVGAYSASVLFADESDVVYDSGVQVALSATIVNKAAIVKRVTITPGSAEASPGSSLDFSANVEGEGDFDKSVTYSVTGAGSTQTTIDSNGHLSIGTNENSSTIKISAVSKADGSVSDVAAVAIKANMHTVNIYANPSEGGSVSGGGNYKDGAVVNLGAYANNGWKFVGWSINNDEVGGSSNYTIQGIDSDVTAVAMFKQSTVKIKAEANHKQMGDVYGSGNYEIGQNVTVEAEANGGYVFKCWMEGKKKVSTDRKYTVKNVKADRTFTAVFAKEDCRIKVASNDETMGKVEGGGKVKVGGSVKIKAVPNKGYRFVKWLWNDQCFSNSAEYTVKDINDDMCLVALFETEDTTKKMCKITSGTTDLNGIISPAGTFDIPEGQSVNFTITPKSGYRILAVAIDGKQMDVKSSFTFSNVKGDHTIVAAFAPNHNETADTTKKAEKNNNSEIYKETQKSGNETYEERLVDMDTSGIKEDSSAHDEDDMDNEMDSLDATLQEMNISREEAAAMIDEGKAVELVKRAIVDENLEIHINNDMAAEDYKVAEGVDPIDDPGVISIAGIVSKMLDKEELLSLVSGDENVSLNICVSQSDEKFVNEDSKAVIASGLPANKVVGTYFYASFVKNVDGVAQVVSELPSPISLKLRVPDEINKGNRVFSVVRLHETEDGKEEVSILDDMDNDPDTITISTDKFSTYGIIYTDDGIANTIDDKEQVQKDTAMSGKDKAKSIGMAAGFIILMLAGIVAVVTFGKKRDSRKDRRRRRR